MSNATLDAPAGLAASDIAFQTDVTPAATATYDVGQTLTACPESGELLDIQYDWDRVEVPSSLREFEAAWRNRTNPLDYSGVWRAKT